MTESEFEQLLARRAARYAPPAETPEAVGEPHVVFRRGASTFAVPLQHLAAIRHDARPARLPGVRSTVIGVVAVAGQVEAVHDLAAMAGTPQPIPESPWLLVGRGPAAHVVLVADAVDGVHPIDVGALHPVPVTLVTALGLGVGVTADATIVLDLSALPRRPELFDA